MNDSSNRAQFAIEIETAESLIAARRKCKGIALDLGFTPGQATLIAAAVSELARNIIQFAGRGEIRLRCDEKGILHVSAVDEGPGIPDIRKALEPGYSTTDGLGLGLPGVQRIAESFAIKSSPRGTAVAITMDPHRQESSLDEGQAESRGFNAIATDTRFAAKPSNEYAISDTDEKVEDTEDDVPLNSRDRA